jgi:hypothetical protein
VGNSDRVHLRQLLVKVNAEIKVVHGACGASTMGTQSRTRGEEAVFSRMQGIVHCRFVVLKVYLPGWYWIMPMIRPSPNPDLAIFKLNHW